MVLAFILSSFLEISSSSDKTFLVDVMGSAGVARFLISVIESKVSLETVEEIISGSFFVSSFWIGIFFETEVTWILPDGFSSFNSA